LKYVWCALTSKYLINNEQIEAFFPIREKQIVINTWHGGGAYKRIGVLSSVYRERKQYMILSQIIRARQTTYIIAACERFKTYMSQDWKISAEKFLPVGMPRNDILFSDYTFKEKIAKYFNLDRKLKIILYAPTFRGLSSNPEKIKFTLNTEKLLKNVMFKFKEEYVLLYRGHHSFSSDYTQGGVISASNYPDMQELLCATDILITDYSSSIWDFSFTFRPCFLYAPDLKKYQNEQGFYTPIEEWLFSLAETNEQLAENIHNFDEEKYKQAVKKHHLDLGSYENGTACEQLCYFLFNQKIHH
jgi:CDP-glycerol glycerophosphotransferase